MNSIDLAAGISSTAEQRRIMWNNYHNIKSWFENWETDLVNLGFANCNTQGKIVISKEQLKRILNIYETCLALDGSKIQRGDRQDLIFYHRNLPQLGKATTKTSTATTKIGGSNLSGKPVPPHFQFLKKSEYEDTTITHMETVAYFHKVLGNFGWNEEKKWPVTICMKKKGGTDDEEFLKYFKNSLVLLYPDVKDESGNRVMLKVDSGPGHLN